MTATGQVLFFFPPYRRLVQEDAHSSILSASSISLGAASIAMYLRQNLGSTAQVYCAFDYSPSELERVIRMNKPEVIGISCWSHNRMACVDLARIAKKVNSKIVIVFGGVHATFLDQQILSHYPEVDYIVRGEGEITFFELLKALRGKEDIASVKGVTLRRDGVIVRTPNRGWVSTLDEFPIIDYKAIALGELISAEQDEELYLNNTLPVETTRGCPFSCLYCSGVGFMGQGVARRSVAKVMEQVGKVLEMGSTGIFFHDMNFTLDRKYVSQICELLIQHKIKTPWVCGTRIDLVDKDLLALLKKAGCRQIFYGVDSLSQKVLHYVGRKYSPEMAIKNVNLTVASDMKVEVNLIVGLPHETQRDRIEMLRNMQKFNRNVQIQVNGLMLFPGAQVYSMAVQEGFDESYWLGEHEEMMPFYTGILSCEEMHRWISILKNYKNLQSTLNVLARGTRRKIR